MISDDADSVTDLIPDSVTVLPPGEETGPFDDLEIADPTNRQDRKDNETPKAGPPRLDEWQDFFSRVLIKGLTERYVSWAFRGIDEELLTDREMQKLHLLKEERERIARPFSELANKAKFTRKHGRTIIGLSDSIDSVLALGMWFGRVNKIAEKYAKTRPVKGKVVKSDVGSGSFEENGTGGSDNGQSGWQYESGMFPESPGTG